MGDLIVSLIALYFVLFAIPHFLQRSLPGLLKYWWGLWIFCAVATLLIFVSR